MKRKEFANLIVTLSRCKKCTKMKNLDKNLINIFDDFNFCTNIPSIWTDWFNRLNSSIMIVGQDWGPFCDMQKLNGQLNKDKSNWQELIESEKSHTKKKLDKFIEESSDGLYSLNDIYVTNAIMCARQGKLYRSDNIDLKMSTLNCSEYLLKQIEIIKPKVILTLGYYPLLSLSKIFDFEIAKTLKETIANSPEIKVEDKVIIPLYHPVAQIKKSEQMKQYERIWKYISKRKFIDESNND